MIVATRSAVLIFDPVGAMKRSMTVNQLRAMFLDRAGAAGGDVQERVPGWQRHVEDRRHPQTRWQLARARRHSVRRGDVDGRAAARRSRRQGHRPLHAEGKHLGTFAAVNTEKLAINDLDDVAAIVRDDKSVAIFDRTGAPLVKIPAKGPTYELRNPVGLAFDALGHLYVLDRGRSSVHIFSPQAKWLTSFTLDPNAPGAFREPGAFAVDPAGRLYIYDERLERVLLYL